MTAEDKTEVKPEVAQEEAKDETQQKEPVKEEKQQTETVDEEQDTSEDAPLVEKVVQPAKPNVHKANYEEDTVYLYCTPRSSLLPSLSPFCLKVESWLRLAGLKYEVVEHNMKLRSRKGQLPFVEVTGEEIADSAVIIKELSRRNSVDLDADLTSQQRGVASCATAMLENHFFWVIKAWRSRNPEQMLQAYNMDLQSITGKTWPKPILNFLFKRKQRKNVKDIEAQGIGLNTEQEIEILGQHDLKEVADLLGEQEYFFGNTPTTLDAVVFANLSQLVYMDPDTECSLRAWLVEQHPKLVAFCHRFKEKVYPDWDEVCSKENKVAKDEVDKESEEIDNKSEQETDPEKLKQEVEVLKAEVEKVKIQAEKNVQDAEKNKRDAEKNRKDAMKNKKEAEKNRKDSIKIKKDSFRLKSSSKKIKKNKNRDSVTLDDKEKSSDDEKSTQIEEAQETDVKEKADDETEKETLKSEEVTAE